MKNLSIFGLFILAILSFNSCETEDDVVFIAQEPAGFVFTNSTSDSYVLSQGTSSNLGERFTWGNADFGTPTNVTYELQSSVTGDFTDAVVVNSTTSNEIAMTIGQMMDVATAAGLDNDPNTPAPNMGSFSVRVRAYVGNAGTEAFSNTLMLNVELLESTGGPTIMPVSWGVVGSGYNDWGNAGPDGTFYSTTTSGVIVTYVTLVTGEIKFRENDDWGNNIGDDGADGTLEANGANIAVTAGDYKITINTNDNTYTMEPFAWGIVGSGYNDWGNAGPDAKFYYDYTTDTFKVGAKLVDGEIKFRQVNDFANNIGDDGADGTVEPNGANIAVTAGHYLVTLNTNDNTYTIEASDVWGVVGSGYNDWGNAGDDFALTQVNPNVFVGDLAALVDGEVKFRANNDFGNNIGDDGADGTLEANGANIAVTAGNYRVKVDLNDNTYMLNRVN